MPESPARPRRPRRWARRGGLILLGTLVGFGLLEGIARILWPDAHTGYPRGLFVADRAAGFRLAPGFSAVHKTPEYEIEIHTSSRGYRSPELREPRGEAVRVLALGDSFGFGHGVDAADSYPAVVETLLVDRGRDIEVVNAGVPGHGTRHQAALLETDAPGLDPDLVIVGLYIGNDFGDNAEVLGRITALSGVLVPSRDEVTWELRLRAAMLARSRLAQAIFLGPGPGSLAPEERVRQFCERLPWDPAWGIAMFRVRWDDQSERAFRVTADWLSRIRDHCAANDYLLLVVLLPGPHQYDPSLWSSAITMCELRAEDYDLRRPNRELAAWAAASGVEVLDLLPRFAERTAEQPTERLYTDVHFNAAGHRLAAATIADRIEALLDR